jgi:hypothetical protein
MSCQIQDYLYAYKNDLTPIPLPGQQVFAVPSSNQLRIQVAGNFRILSDNPGIVSPLYQKGIVAPTDINGQFTVTLPYGATETHPNNPNGQWSLVFPDGRILSGVVPSVAGPLTLDALITSYSWVWTTAAIYTPPASGVEARGTAIFSSSQTATILFLVPMVLSTYQISLSISEDSGSPGSAPNVFWSGKTTSGFTINTGTLFTGSVDWIASL